MFFSRPPDGIRVFFSRSFFKFHFFPHPISLMKYVLIQQAFDKICIFSAVTGRNSRFLCYYLMEFAFSSRSFHEIRVFFPIILWNLTFLQPYDKFAFHKRSFDKIRILYVTLIQNSDFSHDPLTKFEGVFFYEWLSKLIFSVGSLSKIVIYF